MQVLGWVIMGLIAGFIAKKIMPGKQQDGWLFTMLLGIGGALVGGFLGGQLGFGGLSGFDLRTLILSVVGALLIIYVADLIQKRK